MQLPSLTPRARRRRYFFSLGRLSVLLLCLYTISTGAGTIRPACACRRSYVFGLLLFCGLVTSLALYTPHAIRATRLDETTVYTCGVVLYIIFMLVVLAETLNNSKVLKAQLLMIRAQGVDPTTCPAYTKFRFFRTLRRCVLGFSFLQALQTLMPHLARLTDVRNASPPAPNVRRGSLSRAHRCATPQPRRWSKPV